MTGYTGITTAQIDSDSPIVEATLTALRDDPLAMFEGAAGAPRLQTAAMDSAIVTLDKMAANSVDQSQVVAGAIHQAELSTSTGSVSVALGAAQDLILPGGSYGFFPQAEAVGSTGGFIFAMRMLESSPLLAADGQVTAIQLEQVSGHASITLHAHQRYINSSPPYNLGDGDIPLFHFGLLRDGVIVATYTADVPPWGYNGPTSVRADATNRQGKKFRRKRTIDKRRGKVVTEMEEITHTIKNADMGLIPHPFLSKKEGDEVILLNPPETSDLLDMHEAGESIAQLFKDDYLRLDNADLARATPSGVKACRYRWKST